MMSNYCNENVYLGIDLGSTSIKFIGLNEQDQISWSHLILTNPNTIQQISQMDFQQLVGGTIKSVCATGYGRKNITWADNVTTEIICQARGISHLFKDAETVIDIGGQDTKIISINNSRIVNFYMNDKCAAGTGRFIEKVSDILNCPLSAMAGTSAEESPVVLINAMCAIFAETEIVSLIANGKSVGQIINSLYYALANRIANSVKAFGLREKVVLTGGLGQHQCLVYWLEQLLKCKILIPIIPQHSAAYGAALIGKEMVKKRL
jgi:predicted CoA-substrate-specific enzyme activase